MKTGPDISRTSAAPPGRPVFFDRSGLLRGDKALVIRYYAVAAACLVTHNAIMIGADFLGLPLAVSAVIAFLAATAIGYLLHADFTFRQARSASAALAYASSMLFGFVIWIAMIAFMKEALRAPMHIAAPTSSAIMVIGNYLLTRLAFAVRAPTARMRKPECESP